MRLFKVNYQKQEDEQLMRLVAKGDQLAFNEIYQRYASRLCYYFTRKLKHDKEKGEDFVHDLFAKIIDRPELFDPERKFKTWIYSVANNMCINEYKKMAVRSNTSGGLTSDLPVSSGNTSVIDQVEENNFSSDLERELAAMDEKHSSVFCLRHIDGLSVKEVAEVLEINEGTVKSRLFYAMKKIAEALNEYNPKLNE
ncbi:MAG: RNA polymerase sigma factor [Brumimicrobium sp.]|nr:RNA polymerase sigma factor [Brumimicrobium sp.]